MFSAAPDYKNPQTQQASLGIEHEFAQGLKASASGVFVRGSHLTDAYDNNLLPGAPFDPSIGTQNYAADATHPGGYFVNPLIYQSNVYESNSNSFYSGLILEGSKRIGRAVQLNANYTWSHAIDETTDYNSDSSQTTSSAAAATVRRHHSTSAIRWWRTPCCSRLLRAAR